MDHFFHDPDRHVVFAGFSPMQKLLKLKNLKDRTSHSHLYS